MSAFMEPGFQPTGDVSVQMRWSRVGRVYFKVPDEP